jgi:hypothetical protein
MIAPLTLAIGAPAPALPAAGDLEASAHHSRAQHSAARPKPGMAGVRRRGHAGASVTDPMRNSYAFTSCAACSAPPSQTGRSKRPRRPSEPPRPRRRCSAQWHTALRRRDSRMCGTRPPIRSLRRPRHCEWRVASLRSPHWLSAASVRRGSLNFYHIGRQNMAVVSATPQRLNSRRLGRHQTPRPR